MIQRVRLRQTIFSGTFHVTRAKRKYLNFGPEHDMCVPVVSQPEYPAKLVCREVANVANLELADEHNIRCHSSSTIQLISYAREVNVLVKVEIDSIS